MRATGGTYSREKFSCEYVIVVFLYSSVAFTYKEAKNQPIRSVSQAKHTHTHTNTGNLTNVYFDTV